MHTASSNWRASAASILFVLAGCAPQEGGNGATPRRDPGYAAFGEPRRVAISGYDGDAMEPFISPDGRYLLFNNRNDPRVNTDLHFAQRVDPWTFAYRGPVKGANSAALDAVASLDREGNLFFISTRSYAETLSTLYRGRFDDGAVSGVELVAGISQRRRGMVMFDAEIAPSGDTLFVVDGEFTGGAHPKSADIAIAARDGAAFRRLPSSAELLKNVNTKALEYAPAISGDLLELFFTRTEPSSGAARPAIFRSVRRTLDEPFGMPRKVAAITGFVEAPALSGDGRSLYYHKLENDRFVIYQVSRQVAEKER